MTEFNKQQVRALMIAAMIDRLGDLSNYYETFDEVEDLIESQIKRISQDPRLFNETVCFESEDDWFYFEV